MEKALIIIGLILAVFVTLPIMMICFIILASDIYKFLRGDKPPTKDEWKIM